MLNTNEACKKNNITDCGGVIHGNKGQWLGGFAKCVRDYSVLWLRYWGVGRVEVYVAAEFSRGGSKY